MNEPQWTYQDIVNHFVKIIGNGTFTVETINESILLKMLDSKGIKIPVEKSYRDIDKDYKMHLQDIGITMNEPQLSAEMEIVTKFRQFLANWDYAHLTRKVSVEESRQMCDEFALTLATALEEQEEKHRERRTKWAFKTVGEVEKARKEERAKMLSEVESWLVDEEYPITDPDSIDYGKMLASPKNEWNEELRAKLNQLKGE